MDKLIVTEQNGVRRITFNAPERRNAVDQEMIERLHHLVLETARDATRVLVLAGAGDAFCAGADVKGMLSRGRAFDVTEHLRRTTNPTIVALREMAKPVIAAVHGPAVGIGCNYALAADLRIATTAARFGQVFSKIGLIPDGGSTYLLPRLVGYAKAFELMATGEVIDAAQAQELGLVNQVVPPEQLDAAVAAWAERLAAGPGVALAGIKRALIYAETHSLAEALDYEAVTQAECFRSDDFREGVTAFVEKRRPAFQGR
jgi:2-(1,2-epoxy-1,2-dihydrophenyl)acetyl-CoA isomerase